MVIASVWIVISILFAFYLNLQAKKDSKNRTLWFIFGLLLTALGLAIFLYKKGHNVTGTIWVIIWIIAIESFFFSKFIPMSSFLPSFSSNL